MPDYAYSAVDPEYLKKIREYDNQKRATTGRGMTSTDFQALSEAQLNITADRAVKDRAALSAIDATNRSLKIQEDQAKAAKTGAIVSGVSGVVSTAALGKMALDTMKKPPAIAPTGGMPAVTGATDAAAAGAGLGLTAATPASTAAGASGISLVEAETAGLAADTGVGAGGVALEGQAAATGAAETTALGVGQVLEAGGYGGAGYIAGSLIASKIFGANATISGAVGGMVGGGVAGYMIGAEIGSIGGPVGAAIGFVVGGVIGAIGGDSIICTELLRQNAITARERQWCAIFSERNIDVVTLAVYLEWAAPIVVQMKKGGWRNRAILPFARAFAGYMIATQSGKNTTVLQRMIWKYAWRQRTSILNKCAPLLAQEVR